MLISICRPNDSSIVSKVASWGLPTPRSIATTVFTATLAKSANVCWLIPNFFRLSLMVFPISCCVIIPLYCDFDVKLATNLQTRNKNRNKMVFLASIYPRRCINGAQSQYSAIFQRTCLKAGPFIPSLRCFHLIGNLLSPRWKTFFIGMKAIDIVHYHVLGWHMKNTSRFIFACMLLIIRRIWCEVTSLTLHTHFTPINCCLSVK